VTDSLRDCEFQISYGPGDDGLSAFYVPALSCSIRYDRLAGFFSSSALAVAAAGVARLVENEGTMRLLVGAQLEVADIEAIARGHDMRDTLAGRLITKLTDPEDQLMRRRLEVLAWMVAHKTLEIRVVVPKGPDGTPLPASVAQEYFHPKEGLFTDAEGNQVAFSGSVNESAAGWQRNYERFMVFRSWDGSRPFLAQVAHHFDGLWSGQEQDWLVVDVPRAVRERLLRYAPSTAPTYDPLEQVEVVVEEPEEFLVADAEQRERIVFQFLRDAPYLPGAEQLGIATSVVTPWPHQTLVADTIVSAFPERFLLCDEVGLGKTIEAGMAMRQLLLSGRVQRTLILVPASISRQWQEELYEKFVLNVQRYDGHVFIDVFGTESVPTTGNPWDAFDTILASSQLAKRRERQPQLLGARPWDLVVVDEAHHARRKDFLANYYRANRLLELLTALRDRTRGLLLMTATPMQVHPVEVWDLLRMLGLGGRWGAAEENFLAFFQQLRMPFDEVDWDLVFDMVGDFLATGGELDAAFASEAQDRLGLVDWHQLKELPFATKRKTKLAGLAPSARAMAVEMARRHTPLRRFLFRSTRRLLREYREKGLLQANVPTRQPDLEWIPMRREEEALYRRIEEYISGFYQKYEDERKGLGFVMTVYRRRLTSSFYAVRRSLERRLEFLQGGRPAGTTAGLDQDDLELDDLTLDITEDIDEDERSQFRDEIEYVEDFLRELRSLGGPDSKVGQLLKDLEETFKRRRTVMVFTQYTDTMDFLREQLREVYGTQVGCYSGRGGELWNGIAWVTTTKEEIKNAFREGEEIKILLCTEAASEGLNLQSCGVLINYDMPWNPMRVEQRIGRIDRIGQEHDVVWIRNYFYEGTVEAKVYQALEDRIDWFEDVVGELQPILYQVEQVIKSVAMTPSAERERRLREELDRLRDRIEAREVAQLDLDEYLGAAEQPGGICTPVDLSELEAVVVNAPQLKERFQPHPELESAYLLDLGDGDLAATFDSDVFDAHPNTLRLLSYGCDVLEDLLGSIEAPHAATDRRGILVCSVQYPCPLRAYYALAKGEPYRVNSLAELEAALDDVPDAEAWSDAALELARADFEPERTQLQEQMTKVATSRHQAERLALEEQGRELLVRAALVELAMAQQPELFGEETLPTAFTEQAILGLRRHGYPFAPLLTLVPLGGTRPKPTDPWYLRIQGLSRESLRGQFSALEDKAKGLVERLHEASREKAEGAPQIDEVETCIYAWGREGGPTDSRGEQ
jgi:superfamily II DNA or RNA helicase